MILSVYGQAAADAYAASLRLSTSTDNKDEQPQKALTDDIEPSAGVINPEVQKF